MRKKNMTRNTTTLNMSAKEHSLSNGNSLAQESNASKKFNQSMIKIIKSAFQTNLFNQKEEEENDLLNKEKS